MRADEQGQFRDELNRFFGERGIGWNLRDPDGIVFAVARRSQRSPARQSIFLRQQGG